jgi:predicted nucleic acid-binding protein
VSVVTDASLTLSWYFEEERTPAIDAVLDRVTEEGAMTPALWRLEVANGLRMAMRRKRIDSVFRDLALAHLGELPIAVDPETDSHAWTTTLRLADRFDLTLYDAAYLELAVRLSAAARDPRRSLAFRRRLARGSALGHVGPSRWATLAPHLG